MLLKTIRLEYPDYKLWHRHPYEYETDRLAIDLLAAGPFLRHWADDPSVTPADLDNRLLQDENQWTQTAPPFHLY